MNTQSARTDSRTKDPGLEALSRALRSSFRLLQLFILILLVLYLSSGFFTIKPGKMGLVLHLGKIRQKEKAGQLLGPDILEPGAHWSWPEPIDRVVILPAGEQTLKLNLFWYNEGNRYDFGGRKTVTTSLIPGVDGYTISGDRNILHSQWSVNFKIEDPVSYLLATNAEAPQALLESLLARSVVQTVGRMTADQALLSDVNQFSTDVKTAFVRDIEKFELGVKVLLLNYVEKAPPRQTKDAFDAVTNAGNNKEAKVTQARKEAERIIQTSKADASRIESEAEAYKTRIVLEAQADAKTLSELLPKYRENPRLFLRQLYFEGVSEGIANAKEKFVLNSDDSGARQLRITLESSLKYKPKEKKKEEEK